MNGKKIGRPKGSARAKKTIGWSEMKTLIKHIKYSDDLQRASKERWTKVAILSYFLGTRISELLQLHVGDIRDAIRSGEASLTNQTKTKTPRLLIFSPLAVKVIRKYFVEEIEGGYKNGDYLFHSKRGGHLRLNKTAFTRQFNTIIHEALGQLYSSHSFRKGLLTELAQSSIHPRVAQKLIGHSSVQTTMYYFEPSDNDARIALEKVR